MNIFGMYKEGHDVLKSILIYHIKISHYIKTLSSIIVSKGLNYLCVPINSQV